MNVKRGRPASRLRKGGGLARSLREPRRGRHGTLRRSVRRSVSTRAHRLRSPSLFFSLANFRGRGRAAKAPDCKSGVPVTSEVRVLPPASRNILGAWCNRQHGELQIHPISVRIRALLFAEGSARGRPCGLENRGARRPGGFDSRTFLRLSQFQEVSPNGTATTLLRSRGR